MKKFCMLEDNKICDNCLECNICDLDRKKICDNCAKCINTGSDYCAIGIDEIILSKDMKRKFITVDCPLGKHQR